MNSATGDSLRHNLILGNFYLAMRRALEGGPCTAYLSGVSLAVVGTDFVARPDLLVVCGQPSLFEGREDTVTDASVIAEVLSPATEEYDRGEKFRLYQAVPSLREYVLIFSHEPRVDHYRRLDDGDWALNEVCGGEWEFLLDSVSGRIKMADIYREISFPSSSSSPLPSVGQ